MEKTKIYRALAALTKYERNRLRKFVASPVFNEQMLIQKLLEYIDDILRLPEFRVDKVAIWARLHPNQAYNDRKFRRYCSDLFKLVEQFLAFEAYRQDETQERIYLLQQLPKHGLDELFGGSMRQAERKLAAQESQNTHFLWQSYQIAQARHLELEQHIKRTKQTRLAELSTELDLYYIAEKLPQYCAALNYSNVLNIQIDLPNTEILMQMLEAHPEYLETPYIAVYYEVLHTLLPGEQEAHYQKLIERLEAHIDVFSKADLRKMYELASNFCIKKANQGELHYYDALLQLYKIQLEREIIIEDGRLHPWHYKNIITVGVFIRDYDWTEHFIHTYAAFLPPSFKESAVKYNLAKLYFAKKEYEKVIENLREVEYQDISYALGGRWMLIRTYYELEEWDALDALLDSFRIYLHRHKLFNKETQHQYLNNIRFMHKLMRLPKHARTEIEALKNELEKATQVFGKQWMLKKLEEL